MVAQGPLDGALDVLPEHDLIENEAGGLLLVIPARAGAVEEPLLYVGADRDLAVLQRSATDRILLQDFHPEALARLRGAGMVLVSEVEAGDVARVYEALTSLVSSRAEA